MNYILRLTHMIPLKSEISITYIHARDAAVFKATRLGTTLEQPEQVKVLLIDFLQ